MSFFEEQKDASSIKSEIVSKHFYAWATIMTKHFNNCFYLDLFSGPGSFENGKESTPLLITKMILENKNFREKMFLYFNDQNEEHTRHLCDCLRKIPKIDYLEGRIRIATESINGIENLGILKKVMNHYPCYTFVDPFGYKGITKDLIISATANLGSDCILFFNYNRMSAGINNPKVPQHIESFFGTDIQILRNAWKETHGVVEKETLILEILSQSFELNNLKILPFRFQFEDRDATSHYLLYITKNIKGLRIMKDIMHSCSEISPDGVSSFEFIPSSFNQLPLLSRYQRGSIYELKKDLLKNFSNKTILVDALIDQHIVQSPYTVKNYKTALLELENEGKLIVQPTPQKKTRRVGTMAVTNTLIFR